VAVLRVGLTGGIGSGKSAVSALLADHGAVVIDADTLAREVVEPRTSGLAAVVDEFGPNVLNASGGLDRQALGAIVFADPQARSRLNAIVHPLVRARARELELAAPAGSVVVHDIPLLVETDQAGDFDVVVVVDAPDDAQLDRLTRVRGMPESEAVARIDAQATREQRRAAADHVIVNDGSLDDLRRQVDEVWALLIGSVEEG
jgi:dephospho-CoA kinase